MRRAIVLATLALAAAGAGAAAPASPATARREPRSDVEREVLHELVMLPRYGVFDHLAFVVEKGVVTLVGRVRNGSLKEQAEEEVREIEGVREVANKIEILPASIGDDRIRVAVFRAVYGHPGLERYGFQKVPPIHIIVERGRVTLEGVVDREMDKTLAAAQARGVDGVFAVTDNLVVE